MKLPAKNKLFISLFLAIALLLGAVTKLLNHKQDVLIEKLYYYFFPPAATPTHSDCKDMSSFITCVKMKFEIGSNFHDLEEFLIISNFGKCVLNESPKKVINFHCLWRANDLANYGISITGSLNSNYQITEISFYP